MENAASNALETALARSTRRNGYRGPITKLKTAENLEKRKHGGWRRRLGGKEAAPGETSTRSSIEVFGREEGDDS